MTRLWVSYLGFGISRLSPQHWHPSACPWSRLSRECLTTCIQGLFLLSLLLVAMVLGCPVNLPAGIELWFPQPSAFRTEVEGREPKEGMYMSVLAPCDVFTAVQPKTPLFTKIQTSLPFRACVLRLLKQSESGSESTNLVYRHQHESLSYNHGLLNYPISMSMDGIFVFVGQVT